MRPRLDVSDGLPFAPPRAPAPQHGRSRDTRAGSVTPRAGAGARLILRSLGVRRAGELLVGLLAGQLEEALDRRLLVGELVGEQVRALCGALEEVGEAVLGVVGQRVDVAQRRLDAGDAERRPALGERARAAHG